MNKIFFLNSLFHGFKSSSLPIVYYSIIRHKKKEKKERKKERKEKKKRKKRKKERKKKYTLG